MATGKPSANFTKMNERTEAEKTANTRISSQRSGKQLLSELEEKVGRFSRVSHYVLITGERGTGKTTIAKQIHRQSNRAKKEFVNLNCASLTPELLESELFGYEKGAFTGATAPKMGLFEIASGGTLFLDEIGELPLNLQAKLLKAVEEKCIRRVGGNSERAVDTRIIAATSQNLKQMVAGGGFRADLYDRLNILHLETVPLRKQKEKIRDLFLRQLDDERMSIGRTQSFELAEHALTVIEEQDWRGNFRELLNFATLLAVECLDDAVITNAKVEKVLGERTNNFETQENGERRGQNFGAEAITTNGLATDGNLVTITFDADREDLDSVYLKAAGNVIQHVLKQNDNNLRRTASRMNTTHSTLSRIMKKYNAKREFVETNRSPENSFAAAA